MTYAAIEKYASSDRRLYPLLFFVQNLGAVIFFWTVVPDYQEILAHPGSYDPGSATLNWSLLAMAVMQVSYWISYRVRPPMPNHSNALLGHIVDFLARMAFVLASSIFGFIFFTQKPGFYLPPFRYLIVAAGLFSLYCYTEELKRVGEHLMEPKNL